MKDIFESGKVNYILRMYLPRWDFERVIKDVVTYCQETGTEHVMLFTDAQMIVWNQLTIEEARIEAANIARAIDYLDSYRIKVGINSSYNQIPSLADHSKHNLQYKNWVVLADGTEEKRTPCLLDPALKEYLNEFYRILASTKAEYIYIDDDHRYVFTGNRNTWGCMCPLHLAEFSKLTGKSWERESLQKALFSDAGIRHQWIKMLDDSLNTLAEVIGNAVHSVDPEKKVGVMVPCLHQAVTSNYDLLKTARLFQKEGKFLMRPCIGPYTDQDRQQIIPGLFYMEMVSHIAHGLSEFTPEIEMAPFTRLYKSMEVVRLHIAQGIINGMPNPAISACGYTGNSPYLEPEIAKMLKRERPYFESLLKIAPKHGTKKGIGLKFSMTAAFDTPENYSAVTDYYLPHFVLHDFLCNGGFCVTYDDSDVTFLAGGTAYSLSDDELRNLLKKNLILDAAAAKALISRGYASQIGCNVSEFTDIAGGEYFVSESFCGKFAKTYGPCRHAGGISKLTEIDPSAEIISWIVDNDQTPVSPAIIWYENSLGGKISVLHYTIDPITADTRHLLSYQKQMIFRNILRRMSPASMPLTVLDPSCFAVQYFDDGSTVFAAVVNTSYDIAHEIIVEFTDSSADISNGQYLNEDGTLKPFTEIAEPLETLRWKIKKDLSIFHYFAMIFPKKSH